VAYSDGQARAGKQLGHGGKRNLFPAMIRLVEQIRIRGVMIENVIGILDAVFRGYREIVASKRIGSPRRLVSRKSSFIAVSAETCFSISAI